MPASFNLLPADPHILPYRNPVCHDASIQLERVPGLLDEHKRDLRMYLTKNKDMGAHNVPRKFGTVRR